MAVVRLDPGTCRARLAAARVAYLATTGSSGPHVVPVVLALVDEHVLIAVDQKPKATLSLQRLRNVANDPRVAVLCDRYDEDWTQLWWVRADGTAVVIGGGSPRHAHAIGALAAKYPQYHDDPPRGPVIDIAVTAWSGWAYADPAPPW